MQGAVTKDLEFYVFDVSPRVPGCPCVEPTSPYMKYKYGVEVGPGKRVAMEIKRALQKEAGSLKWLHDRQRKTSAKSLKNTTKAKLPSAPWAPTVPLTFSKAPKKKASALSASAKKKTPSCTRNIPLVDELIIVKDFTELLSEKLQERLRKLNVVLIPHGSFTAYLSTEELTDSLFVPMFGNRELLHWEANRKEQEEWLRQAGLRLPATFKSPEDIDRLIIAKLQGAKGGRGYFLANSPKGFYKKVQRND